jgi:nitrite reductase/ring-hydroxylating ferredoxin subunit
MTLTLGWVPVALAAGLEPGTSTGTRIAGSEVVVWRDDAGASHVWEDRCPHRGMRLSFGFVRGNHIACLYHGWQYDTAGQCRLIPAHPDIKVPSTIRATRYVSMERLGIVWTDLAGDAPNPPPVPDGAATAVRSLAIMAPRGIVLEHVAPDGVARLSIAGLAVVAAVQPVSENETAVHVVIEGAHGPAAQKNVSAWAVALRARLEEMAA